ncbi:thioredoxin family protein [Streptomyces sp. NBC_00658]|uniref:thioredoxin family protein n=1 Tax=Streptomyces sp. NBC_00658 TaxID=2975800 RepID=UPI00324CCCEB
MSRRVPYVNAEQLTSLRANADRPLLVEFTAKWCPPCKELRPELKKFARAERDRLQIVAVDVDDHDELSETYGVHAIPTLVLFHQGAVVAKMDADLERVSELLDALEIPLPAFAFGPGPGEAAQPRPARRLHFTGPVLGGLEITAQPGLATATDSHQAGVLNETVVEVPVGHTVSLTFTENLDFTPLTGLAPDALDSLLIDVGEGRDVDLTPVLRLTGLTDLRIWGETLPAGTLDQLAAMTGLRNLEIPDEALTQAGLDALHASLPFTVINSEWIDPSLRARLPVPTTAHRPRL